MKKTLDLPTNNSRTVAGKPVTFDEHVKVPQLNAKVFIVGFCFIGGAIQMFARAGCTRAKTLGEADLVVFLGGEDVHPSFYNEQESPGCYYNKERDKEESLIFDEAVKLEIPIFGICRGMQLIHALTGSKLYYDVDNHGRGHMVTDLESGEQFIVSSMHHQMCIEDGKQIPVLASYGVSGKYRKNGHILGDPQARELEAAFYPEYKAFGVQGHPEVGGYNRFTQWTIEHLERLIYDDNLPLDVPSFLKRSITE